MTDALLRDEPAFQPLYLAGGATRRLPSPLQERAVCCRLDFERTHLRLHAIQLSAQSPHILKLITYG